MAIEAGRLRNVGLLGHRGAGKTSLGEALLFAAGSTNRAGRVEDGSSAFDHEPEEIQRQVSISTAFHSLEWQKTTCVLVDTPGFATFLPETVHSLPACGGTVFVLHASAGLRVEAERLWGYAAERGLPRMFFVNRMDREESDPMEAVDAIVGELGGKAVHVQLPIGHGESFRGVVDLIRMKAVCKEGDGKETEEEIPAELRERAEEMRVNLTENVAETQDELLEKYLEGQELTSEEISEGLRAAVKAGALSPVLYGSATRGMGVPAFAGRHRRMAPVAVGGGRRQWQESGDGGGSDARQERRRAVLGVCLQDHRGPLRGPPFHHAGALRSAEGGQHGVQPGQGRQGEDHPYIPTRGGQAGGGFGSGGG